MRIRLNISMGISRSGNGLLAQITELIREHHAQQRRQIERSTEVQRAPEFLWRYTSPMEEYEHRWVPHRIVRRTDQSILVEVNPHSSEHPRRESLSNKRLRTYWLERAELERIGFARSRSRRVVFFSSPQAGTELVETIESLTRLGLWWPYTEDDVRQAYRRRALLVHPDAGGSEEKFVRLQEDLQRAMAWAAFR